MRPEDATSEAPVVESTTQSRGARGALFRNSLAQMMNVIIGGLTILVLTRIVVQQLGLDAYGLYSTALGIAGLFGVLADLGFTLLTIREMNRDPNNVAQTFAR